MQMTFILIYWLGNLQALLAQTAQALPFLILMTLLAGRKGNAALCLWGGRQLLRLGLFCAALSLPLFPLMLLLETLRQPQMPPGCRPPCCSGACCVPPVTGPMPRIRPSRPIAPETCA